MIDDLYLVVRENALDIIQLLVAHGSDTDARKEAPLNNIVLRSLLMTAIYPIRFQNDPHFGSGNPELDPGSKILQFLLNDSALYFP
jgi:hypothetical protein